jgi:hypothetical protein
MNTQHVTVMCNQSALSLSLTNTRMHTRTHTHTHVTANRPHITIKNKIEKNRLPRDVATSADRNVVQKVAEKKLKYRGFCTCGT